MSLYKEEILDIAKYGLAVKNKKKVQIDDDDERLSQKKNTKNFQFTGRGLKEQQLTLKTGMDTKSEIILDRMQVDRSDDWLHWHCET